MQMQRVSTSGNAIGLDRGQTEWTLTLDWPATLTQGAGVTEPKERDLLQRRDKFRTLLAERLRSLRLEHPDVDPQHIQLPLAELPQPPGAAHQVRVGDVITHGSRTPMSATLRFALETAAAAAAMQDSSATRAAVTPPSDREALETHEPPGAPSRPRRARFVAGRDDDDDETPSATRSTARNLLPDLERLAPADTPAAAAATVPAVDMSKVPEGLRGLDPAVLARVLQRQAELAAQSTPEARRQKEAAVWADQLPILFDAVQGCVGLLSHCAKLLV